VRASSFVLRPIGRVESSLTDPDTAPNPKQGVFSTRSPDRPNPIGLHRAQIASIEGTKIRVRNLEALDGTPILDVKPVLDRRLDG